MTDFLRYRLEDSHILKKVFSPQAVIKAELSARNKTTTRAKTMISRFVRQDYNVKAGVIASTVKIKRGKRDNLIVYTGSGILLENFRPGSKRVQSSRGARRAATINVKKSTGRRPVGKPSGFHGSGFYEGGKVMARKSPARDSARKLYGISVAQMVSNADVLNNVNDFIGTEYPKQFDVAMNFFGNVKNV